MQKEIGLVLSGGGVRAVAHIGLIKALLEHNIKPNHISGTSGGALVGALYAAEYSIDDMISFFKKAPIYDFSLFAIRKPGLIDSKKYVSYFKTFFPKNSYESLKYPLTTTATNLLSGKLEYFNTGELIKPLIASSAIPPLFSPVKIKTSFYCDGGVLDNFPLAPIQNRVKNIVGSFVNPIGPIDKSEINSAFKLINRVYHLGLDAKNLDKFDYCNYVFQPKGIESIGIMETKKIDAAFEIGYEEAIKQIDSIIDSTKF